MIIKQFVLEFGYEVILCKNKSNVLDKNGVFKTHRHNLSSEFLLFFFGLKSFNYIVHFQCLANLLMSIVELQPKYRAQIFLGFVNKARALFCLHVCYIFKIPLKQLS